MFEFVEKSQTNCLNQKDEHPWEAMLKVQCVSRVSPTVAVVGLGLSCRRGNSAVWPPSLSQPETDGSCLPQGGDDDQYCESNVDEQLLLNIGFREKVKIKVPPDPKSAHQRG